MDGTKSSTGNWKWYVGFIILAGVVFYIIWGIRANNIEARCEKWALEKSVLTVMNQKPFEENVKIRQAMEDSVKSELFLQCIKSQNIDSL